MKDELKAAQFWKKLEEDLPNSYKELFEEERKYLIQIITKNSKVLDIGTGDGRNISNIISLTKNITAIDIDEEIIKITKRKFKDYPEIKILTANAKNLPFDNDVFDFVLCLEVLANLGDLKLDILKELKRVVKKNGLIIISSFSEDAFEERRNVYKKLNAPIKKINGTTVIFDKDIGISEQFSREQLIDLFSKSNLEVLEIKKIGIGYICKLRK